MPSLKFVSSEADDAKWLIWGKILHAKGTRGSKFPDPNVLVKITDMGVLVQRFPQTYYYTGNVAAGNVAAPCQCRGLSIVVQAPNFPSKSTSVVLTNPSIGPAGFPDFLYTATSTLKDNTGAVVGVSVGTVLDNILLASGSGHQLLRTYTYSLFGDGAVGNQVPATSRMSGIRWQGFTGVKNFYADGTTDEVGVWTEFDPSFESLASAGRSTLILLSDGTQLASIPYTDDGAGNKTNYPQITTWSGDGWIQLFSTTDSGAHWTAGVRATFTVPEDVCFVPSSAPALPTGAAASLPNWAVEWAAAQAGAIVRERARRKTCSDNLKANLKAGTLQDQIKKVLRSGHPVSANTYQKALMTANVVNGSSGSGDDITNTKTVTLSYQSTDSNGNPITLQQVVTGTQHIVITRCANSSGTPNAANYTTTTYTNWLPTSTTGDTGTALDYTYQLDNTHGLAQMWNGVVVTGAATIAATFDSLGGIYSPPYQQSSDTRTYSYPQLYTDYRAATARLYKVGSHNAAWLDSCFKNGETIDLFPLSVVHADLGDLGMFPQAADITGTSKLTLQADRKATFKYNYNTGVWAGSGANLKDTNQNDTTISIPYQAGANMVFRSRTTPWADVATDSPLTDASYKGQAAAIKATPGDYPLFVPLLTS